MHSAKLTVFSIVGIMLVACSQPPSQQQPPAAAVPVLAQEALLMDVPAHFESIGTVKPSAFVEIRPQASGMLTSVHFVEGDNVKKGDLLFSIDPAIYEIRLHEAEAQLAQNKTALDIAHKTLSRYSGLASKDLIAQQEWDQLQAQVLKSEAQIKADEAKIESARLDLKHCSIVAPMDGKIGKIQVHPGNLVSANQAAPLALISKIDVLNIEFTITEKEYQQLLMEGRKDSYGIEISSFNSEDAPCTGVLTYFDHCYDSLTGLLSLKAQVDNSHMRFLPGQQVHVKLPFQTLQDAVVIPQKSIKIDQQGPYVYVVKEDSTVEIRPVKLGDEVAKNVIVKEGLQPKEQIVTDGHLRLFPGAKVVIKQWMGTL